MNQSAFTRTVLATAALACLSGSALADTPLASLAAIKADMSIYGFLNGQIESVEATGGATPYRSRGRVSDGNSRIGFKGNIGVSDDLKAIWQLEGSLNSFDQGGTNTRGETSTLTTRNSYVGLSSVRFGTVIVGNNDSVYRSLVGSGGEFGGNLGLTVHGLDVWNNTSAQMSGNADSVFSRGESRYKNSAHYLSPVWNGLQAGASYGFDENRDNDTRRNRWALAVKYTNGPLTLGAGYDRQNDTGVDTAAIAQGLGFRTTGAAGTDTTFAKVDARYVLPTHTMFGIGFEQAKYGFLPTGAGNGGGTMKQNAVLLSVAQDIDNLSLMAGAGKLYDLKNATFGNPGDYGAKQYSLGALYNFNKYLASYVYYTKISNDSQQNVNLGQTPLYSNNNGKSNAYLAPGDSPRAFGVGLIARF